jgi:hypothetical protein
VSTTPACQAVRIAESTPCSRHIASSPARCRRSTDNLLRRHEGARSIHTRDATPSGSSRFAHDRDVYADPTTYVSEGLPGVRGRGTFRRWRRELGKPSSAEASCELVWKGLSYNR